MQGLEISEKFFEEYGRPMLEAEFHDVLPLLAAGLMGSGSECFGFDDEVSRDHDFEPGFCLFIPGEDKLDRRTAFLLERAYQKLPMEYMELRRSLVSPVGGSRHGVIAINDFLEEKLGTSNADLDVIQWLTIPEQSLLEATNGKIFFDNSGSITEAREKLRFFPEDVFLKKLASSLLLMAQSGQYNYRRCISHGETGAAQLALFDFCESASHVIFLLNGRYMPYYKWRFRAMRGLPKFSEEADLLEYLITTGNGGDSVSDKEAVIDTIVSDVIDCLMDRSLTDAICQDLEKHAYSVNDRIRDGELRNMHILAAI